MSGALCGEMQSSKFESGKFLISEEAISERLLSDVRAHGGITGGCFRSRSRKVADRAHLPAASPISTPHRTLMSGCRAIIKVGRPQCPSFS